MITKVYVFLALSSIVCCLGKLECGLESCNNLEIVKKCGNVQECINNVWLKEKTSVYHADICDTCLQMVKQARDVLRSNNTKEMIKEVFEGSCALLKIPVIVKYCDKFADEYAIELVAMLSSQMDPDTVCTVARLCSANNPNDVPKECSDCQRFVYVSSMLVNKITLKEFEKELLKVCRHMGSFSDACFYYTPLFADFLLNQTKYTLENHPCKALDICPKYSIQTQLLSIPLSLKEDRTVLCSLCPSAMTSFKNRLNRIKSFQEFKKDVFKVCSSLSLNPSSCNEEDNTYIEDIYIYLNEYFDPTILCSSDLLFCSDNKKSDSIPDWPLLPANYNFPPKFDLVDIIKPSIALEIAPKKESRKKVKIDFGDVIEATPIFVKANVLSSFHCKSCFKMIDSLHKFLNSQVDLVEEFAQAVCFTMHDSGSCFQLVETYLKKFVSRLGEMYDSSKVCPQLVSDCFVEQHFQSNQNICVECMEAVEIVKKVLNESFVRDELLESVPSLCSIVSSHWESVCHNFINSTLTRAYNSLEKATSNETCSSLKMCTAITFPTTATSSRGSCKICMLVIQTIYDEVEDPQNEEKVKKVLGTVCSTLPSHLRGECEKIVETYAEQIINLVLQNLKPSEVCRRINFCPRNSITRISDSSKTQHDLTKSEIPCSFCISTVNTLLDELGNQKTEEQIKQLLDKLCNIMPYEVQDTCKALVSQFSDQIIDMIIADFNATEICTFLKICGPKITASSFRVFTNEMTGAYNPFAACEFCKFLQVSLSLKENKDQMAEIMLTFLQDVCLTDSKETFGICKSKTIEILPKGKTAILETNNICNEFEICSAKKSNDLSYALKNIHTAVQECAMCEFLVEVISKREKMLDSEYDFTKSAHAICAAVPQDKNSMCKGLLISYGPSVVNLILNSHVNPEKVCGFLNICDERQQVKLGMPVSEKEPKLPNKQIQKNSEYMSCMQGPDFWCKNKENARLCGTYLHCQEAVWKNGIPLSVKS